MPQDRIAKLRKVKAKRHLSYEKLGHALGVHPISVFRWLQKGVVPRSRAYHRVIDEFLAKNGSGVRRKKRGVARRSYGKPGKAGF